MASLVSVIIPIYNAQAFIADCLDSVLMQSYTAFEIIAVNDGSTDATPEILAAYAERDSRIKVINKRNGGVSAARNTGLKHASGAFITFVDADDTFTAGALEYMVSQMKEDVDFLVCSHNEVRLSSIPRHETPASFENRKERDRRFTEFDRVIWWPWAKMLRADVIRNHHLEYDTSLTFGEDHVFNLLFAKHMTGKAIISDTIVYNYYYIRGGLSSKYYADFNAVQKYIYTKIADYFGGLEAIPLAYKRHYSGAYLSGCVDYYAAWCRFSQAVKKVEECFALYADIIDDDTVKQFFSPKQFTLYKQGNFRAFTRDYILKNPKKTVIRKGKRTVRRVLELLQKQLNKRK